MTNEATNGIEIPDNGDDIEPAKGKATKFELPKILTYDEIDRFLLAINDLEDMIAARVSLFAGLRVGEVSELLVRGVRPREMRYLRKAGQMVEGPLGSV